MSSSKRSPGQKPVAILIAAQMRVAPGGIKPHKPVNVNKALRAAMNGSPQARAAFKNNKAAVNQAKPHLQALANRQGQGLMSSLKHGVSAMRSLKQVTRDMAKQPGANKLKVESSVPLNAKAQKHMDGIAKAMEGPKPNLFSALGQGIGLMREMRRTTRQMKQDAMRGAHMDTRDAKATTTALSPMAPPKTGAKPGQGVPKSGPGELLGALGQGVRMLQAAKQVTRQLKAVGTTQGLAPQQGSDALQGFQSHGFQALQALARGGYPGESPIAIMLIARRRGAPPGDESPRD
ncbi:MAG: hypothetical protein KF800_03615 [Lysobacter sp.]|nr:hypothetical protein [Lysobacter sp.]